MLELRSISASYDGAPALVDIDIRIGLGEVVALIGPSGAGKSTLLDIAAGLLVPDEGRVLIDGSDVSGRPGSAALMPQADLLLAWRDVAGNVALPLEIRGVAPRQARERAIPLLRRVGLGDVVDARPQTLSGGMRQRVAVARTLIQERGVTLLDEPFGALDGVTRLGLQRWLLDRWTETPSAALLVTHDVAEAALLADRVLVMSPSPGRIVGEVHVPLPRPRPVEVELTPAFAEIEREVRRALRCAVDPSQREPRLD